MGTGSRWGGLHWGWGPRGQRAARGAGGGKEEAKGSWSLGLPGPVSVFLIGETTMESPTSQLAKGQQFLVPMFHKGGTFLTPRVDECTCALGTVLSTMRQLHSKTSTLAIFRAPLLWPRTGENFAQGQHWPEGWHQCPSPRDPPLASPLREVHSITWDTRPWPLLGLLPWPGVPRPVSVRTPRRVAKPGHSEGGYAAAQTQGAWLGTHLV